MPQGVWGADMGIAMDRDLIPQSATSARKEKGACLGISDEHQANQDLSKTM